MRHGVMTRGLYNIIDKLYLSLLCCDCRKTFVPYPWKLSTLVVHHEKPLIHVIPFNEHTLSSCVKLSKEFRFAIRKTKMLFSKSLSEYCDIVFGKINFLKTNFFFFFLVLIKSSLLVLKKNLFQQKINKITTKIKITDFKTTSIL